jgi:hypothetical protein
MVHEAKRLHDSPYIIVAGDFNQFDIGKELEEHVDISECNVGPTRGDRLIDCIFTNFGGDIHDTGTLEPLQPNIPDQGAPSDHRVAYFHATIEGRPHNPWHTHFHRPYTEAGAMAFEKWVVGQKWEEVLAARGSNKKAEAYQKLVEKALEECFPLRKTRRRKMDPPWIKNWKMNTRLF